MKRTSWIPFFGFATAVASVAWLGRRSQATGRDWFRTLEKPSFNPPDWVFGPIWTGLYATMAYSAFRVWRAPKSKARTRALTLWGIQLTANAVWTPLFFAIRAPRAALFDIGALLVGIGGYAWQARHVDRPAAWMMVPYAVWVSFAGALNEEFVRLNP